MMENNTEWQRILKYLKAADKELQILGCTILASFSTDDVISFFKEYGHVFPHNVAYTKVTSPVYYILKNASISADGEPGESVKSQNGEFLITHWLYFILEIKTDIAIFKYKFKI